VDKVTNEKMMYDFLIFEGDKLVVKHKKTQTEKENYREWHRGFLTMGWKVCPKKQKEEIYSLIMIEGLNLVSDTKL
jgi:hypothetical protein